MLYSGTAPLQMGSVLAAYTTNKWSISRQGLSVQHTAMPLSRWIRSECDVEYLTLKLPSWALLLIVIPIEPSKNHGKDVAIKPYSTPQP